MEFPWHMRLSIEWFLYSLPPRNQIHVVSTNGSEMETGVAGKRFDSNISAEYISIHSHSPAGWRYTTMPKNTPWQ
jgi:hypothetical protein